jgi:hypothetical protein
MLVTHVEELHLRDFHGLLARGDHHRADVLLAADRWAGTHLL